MPLPGDEALLLAFLAEHEATIVRHGGCQGFDMWAGEVARSRYHVEVWPATIRDADRWKRRKMGSYHVLVMPPRWAHWPSAGPLRNQAMLAGNGFPAKAVGAMPGGRGTHGCISLADAVPGTDVTLLRLRAEESVRCRVMQK